MEKNVKEKAPSLFGLIRPYRGIIAVLAGMTVIASALSISVPKLVSIAIDTYMDGSFSLRFFSIEFGIVAALIFVFTYLQSIVQVYAAERVARDLRNELAAKISIQPYAYIESVTPAKIMTNLTSDVDSVKAFVSTAISSIISSAFLIVGVSALLLLTDWQLGLAVLAVVPFIASTFFFIFNKVRKLFVRAQETIDWLNKVIGESIFGAALIRLLHSQEPEYDKFLKANTEAKKVSLEILSLFSGLVPAITFFTNLATLIIIMLGGHFVIQGTMTLGNFTAFNSYLAILIFPIMLLGFISNVIAQAQASYGRISAVLNTPPQKEPGGLKAALRGDVEVRDMTVKFGDKLALKDITFSAPAGSKTAIIGPTAAGKTQLLCLLIGLLGPTSGKILFDGKEIGKYQKESMYGQIGIVFQDSIIFNLSLRENIAFSNTAKDEDIRKAIETAELSDFIDGLPQHLDTIISERGSSLSGGQKQRIMLARALAINPKILLLDDFTARVDASTEKKILANVEKNYPGLTLISVTQKISSIEHYDQIIVLMDGELLAKGTHAELMHTSPEYVQIFRSQSSISQFETSDET